LMGPQKRGRGAAGEAARGCGVVNGSPFEQSTQGATTNVRGTSYDQRADGERVLGRIVFMFV
jgi:hypothetical protein